MKYLLDNKIIYRQDWTTDKPDEVYDWGYVFHEGTYQCYHLFNSKAAITTYKSLKWHLLTLWYLNPQLDQQKFNNLVDYIVDKRNKFVTFTIPPLTLENLIYDVSMMDLDRPPPNRLRKIIFRDNCGLTLSEKRQVIGHMVGKKKLSEGEIYDAMLMLSDDNKKITGNTLSKLLGVSERTIYRNMNNELKKEKKLLNELLKN